MKAFLLLLSFILYAGPVTAEPAVAKFSLFPRKPINTAKLGVNAFANDQRFGSVGSQLREVKRTLRLRYIRVLFAWNDQVQPSKNSAINFSFYDEIANNIPRGVNALIIMTGLPSWMSNSSNWIGGEPRKTFAELWVKQILARYGKKARVAGFQLWNEPNDSNNPDNDTLALTNSPENYIELAALVNSYMNSLAPRKKLVSAATTAINQNYPETLQYNESLRDGGVQSLVDVYAFHYYGSHYETLLLPGGVGDFLNSLDDPLWITEIGEKGVNKQRAYMERTFPLLLELIPGIKRAYYYQFTESTPANSTYGLRNLTPGFTVSDLYIWLRDRR
jgi:hypothetical protein